MEKAIELLGVSLEEVEVEVEVEEVSRYLLMFSTF